ncbi:MAG TPA: dihydrodipicolinate reductase [Sphingobium sp.]|uniref:NAD(P)H-dependent amine dehydrogenase family protein n=1 Tax=Sphingobium sp. TaxID=1912891 RepID=UPI002ED27FCC
MTNSQPAKSATKMPYRVVQWATGNVGSRAMRQTIRHPDLELVGCYVHSADKAGRDAGELCGIAPIGVTATNRIEDVLALKPDCVLYMPHELNYDEVCAILESGSNIVSSRMEFHNPAWLEPSVRARVEAACALGGTSIHASGASPGFITEALPIALASIQRRLDCLTVFEYADCSTRNSPEMLFEMMGFGSKPDETRLQHMVDHLRLSFAGSIGLMADAFGIQYDSIEARGALGVARQDVHIVAGVVPAGTVAAERATIAAMRDGKPVYQVIANWYVSSDVDTTDGETWDFRSESGWRVLVEGDCPMDISITFPVAPKDYAEFTPGLTANRPVNAIPYVCEAAPGFQTIVDLPQVIAKLG